jgi:cell division protein ZapA
MTDRYKTFEVKVFGTLYMLKSDEPLSRIQLSAARVDTAMRELAEQYRGLDPKKIAVLVALTLASNYSVLDENQNDLDGAVKRLIHLIDTELAHVTR